MATVLGLGIPGPVPCSGYRQETPRGRVKCPYPGPPPIVDLGQGPSFNVGDVSQGLWRSAGAESGLCPT